MPVLAGGGTLAPGLFVLSTSAAPAFLFRATLIPSPLFAMAVVIDVNGAASAFATWPVVPPETRVSAQAGVAAPVAAAGVVVERAARLGFLSAGFRGGDA